MKILSVGLVLRLTAKNKYNILKFKQKIKTKLIFLNFIEGNWKTYLLANLIFSFVI